MDIAAMSVIMANSQVRADASVVVMDHAMQLMEQQGTGLAELLQSSAPHPTLGSTIDLKL